MLLKSLTILFHILYPLVSNNLVETCGCQPRSYKPYLERPKFLVKLANSHKLNDLALIGTHSSFSYNLPNKEVQTQDLNIVQQLKYGIRVLDISVRPQFNVFEIYPFNYSKIFNLDDAIEIANKFLDSNPGELIIMYINQDHPSTYDITLSNCDIMNFYINDISNGKRLVKNWQLNDTIGQHRGKILLASTDHSFDNCTLYLKDHCLIQNNKVIQKTTKSITIEAKWWHIYQLRLKSSTGSYKCYINDLSLFDGIHNRHQIARDGGFTYLNGCAKPLNDQLTKFFTNSHRALSIVLADYPTQELMDTINNSNFS
ncbi:uncharacterized protein LOC103575877 [Microplitis demolitor]|uniref:uncharacterized protein LOC103575877 n=1 Tax=Microplitis demolitor TaxID=69319 RepID=UPI0004CCE0B5|nr:uncharacterized protein LOC103575877 [Microplitis demolitor]